MIDIQSMNTKEWNQKKESLEHRLRFEWGSSRISRVDKDAIVLEGGALPIFFKITDGKVYVHNKCSRRTGGRVEIDKLLNLKEILKEWAVDNFKEELFNE